MARNEIKSIVAASFQPAMQLGSNVTCAAYCAAVGWQHAGKLYFVV